MKVRLLLAVLLAVLLIEPWRLLYGEVLLRGAGTPFDSSEGVLTEPAPDGARSGSDDADKAEYKAAEQRGEVAQACEALRMPRTFHVSPSGRAAAIAGRVVERSTGQP